MSFSVKLIAEELALLDGKCRPEIQAEVNLALAALDMAKRGLTASESVMVAAILAEAKLKGKLILRRVSVKHCPCCDRSDGYYPAKRTTKFKTKGRPDFDNPKLFTAWEMQDSFISIKNRISLGFCETCRSRVEPIIADCMEGMECETPPHWSAVPSRFKKFPNRHCTGCGWDGHEGEMLKLPILMGDGYYPGGCPKCPAKNLPLGRRLIEDREGFVLVKVPQEAAGLKGE